MSIELSGPHSPRTDPFAVLAKACAMAGLNPRGATMVHAVDNAVFMLAGRTVVGRVALMPELARRARVAVSAARTLTLHGVPTVRPLSLTDNPVHVDGTAVSFWHHTEAIRQRPTIAQLSHLLTLMHGIPAADIALPHWNPIPDLRARIACGSCWDARDLAFLERRCAAVESALLELRFSSPAAVIHGDAHPGNIIMAENGPVLCDLDTVSIGPREWDLVPVAVSQLRFRQLVDVHDEMAAAYGMDVTAWDGFPVLRELRELSLATGGPMASLHPAAGFEVRRRLRSLRTRRDGMAWIPLGSARQR